MRVRVLVYEFVTGGGWYACGDGPAPESLVREGRAMRDALAADFSHVDGAAVDVLQDGRGRPIAIAGITSHVMDSAAAEQRALARLAREADWTVVISPEFDGHLLARVELVERAGGRLLGPSSQVVALAGDKQSAAEHLARHGIPVPRGIALAPGAPLPLDFPYPAVLKPRDGAGSLGIEWIDRWPEGRTVAKASRLEEYCPGKAASVACLCGPGRIVALEPCRQDIAAGTFAYRGGSLPLAGHLAERARRLAGRAVANMGDSVGYIGVDLILGDDEKGRGDVVIEVNPRLTTSYIGLRALARTNLAAAMIDVACGRDPRLCWNSGEVHFTSSGRAVSSVRDCS